MRRRARAVRLVPPRAALQSWPERPGKQRGRRARRIRTPPQLHPGCRHPSRRSRAGTRRRPLRRRQRCRLCRRRRCRCRRRRRARAARRLRRQVHASGGCARSASAVSLDRETGRDTRCARACTVAHVARAGALIRRRRRRGGAEPHVAPVFASLRQPKRRLCGGADTALRESARTRVSAAQLQLSATRCALWHTRATHRRARAAPLPAARAAAAPPHR